VRTGFSPSSGNQEVERPGALRAGFDDYGAADLDEEHDAADAGRRIGMPLLALWGEHSFLKTIDTLGIWREYAEDVSGTMIEDCGHFLAEERPEAVLEALEGFLPDWKAGVSRPR
jgi:haloacetate dehalogenase